MSAEHLSSNNADDENEIYVDERSVQPQNSQEALELLQHLIERLEKNSLVTSVSDGKTMYPDGEEGKLDKKRIMEIISQWGKEPALVEYMAGKKAGKQFKMEMQRENRKEELTAAIKQLEEKLDRLRKELESLE